MRLSEKVIGMTVTAATITARGRQHGRVLRNAGEYGVAEDVADPASRVVTKFDSIGNGYRFELIR